MKKRFSILPLCALLVLGLRTQAQTTVSSAPQKTTPQKSTDSQMPKIGKLYGKLVDDKSGKPVSNAHVDLLQIQNGKKVLLQTLQSDTNGDFSFYNLSPTAQYELVVSSPGHRIFRQEAGFDMAALMKANSKSKGFPGSEQASIAEGSTTLLNAVNKDLGNIHISPNEQNLKEITIAAKTPGLSFQGEKKVFDVTQNLVTQGGTAADVMKQVPGIMIDADNKVTLRNSSPQILVDGRQTPLQIDQIPADAISTIEIITNPSAKYDAEAGGGGVLNIVLKKNRKKGYNGSVRMGADSRAGANLGGDLNVRSGKINISFTGQSMLSRSMVTATTSRSDFYTTPHIDAFQEQQNETKGNFGFGWLGLDYFISNRTTLSVAGMKIAAVSRPSDDITIQTDSLFPSGTKQAWSTRNTDGKSTFDMNGGQFNLKHIFPRPGQELTIDASINSGKSTYDTRYFTTAYPTEHLTNPDRISRQQTAGNSSNTYYMMQSDYTRPLASNSKFDIGIKTTVRQVENSLFNYYFDNIGNQKLEIADPYSKFKSTDAVYAVYSSFSTNFNKKNAIQLGLRIERSQYVGELLQVGTSFAISYPVSLFPSLFYTLRLKHNQELQFSYRRGINRPNFFQLLPYTDFTDPLNIRQGNPALRPEFTNTVELGYMKKFKGNNYIYFCLYERHTSDLIAAYQSPGFDPFTGQSVIITSYTNASFSNRFGVELISGWDLTKWWNINANANIYNAQLNPVTGAGSNYFSGFGKLNNQFRLPSGWSAQVTGIYQSRTNLLPDTKNQAYGGGRGILAAQPSANAQGYLESQWYADASVRKSFLKNNTVAVALSVSDIFGTRKFIQYSETSFFAQDYRRLINPRMIRLSFNWRFGKTDMDLFRRKNIKSQMEGIQDVSQNVGI
ncbi:MAG TPA: TonB-dependent receptor [Flavipsychrobacter sp.]|nr:TonB-dependent receptor [Flavipsychrobacter sp.]